MEYNADFNSYALIAGAILSLFFSYVPGFKTWYEKLQENKKQLLMLGLLFVAVAGRFGLGCLGKDASFACTIDGAYEALVSFILAVMANAGIYKATSYIYPTKETH